MKSWIIVDDAKKQNYTILGIFIPTKSTSQIPRGTTPWKLFDQNCNETRILKLSSVRIYNFFQIIHLSDIPFLYSAKKMNLLVMMAFVLKWIKDVIISLIVMIKVMKNNAKKLFWMKKITITIFHHISLAQMLELMFQFIC